LETLIRNNGRTEQNNLADYLQECVAEASKIIAAYWPISTFIASNGLANLESQPFAEAMQYAQEVRGTQGYLPLASYHKFFAQGRINETDLEAVISATLEEPAYPQTLKLGDNTVTTTRLYRFWLTQKQTPEEVQKQYPALWETVLRQLTLLNLLDSPAKSGAAQLETIGERSVASDGQTVTEIVNQHLITWCAAFLDEGQASWAMPGREQGFYQCWKNLAGYDKSLNRYKTQKISRKVQALPASTESALLMLLQQLKLPQNAWADYLTRHLAQLPGWASLIRWRQEHPEVPGQQHQPINLVEYLTVRVFYEVLLVEAGRVKTKDSQTGAATLTEKYNAGKIGRIAALAASLNLKPAEIEALPSRNMTLLAELAGNFSTETQQMIWQEAYENHYRQQLLRELSTTQPKPVSLATPAAQAVFCIDVRSEGFRRNLEKLGVYETFGFAGFFGVPMLYQPLGSSCDMTVAPALVTPTQVVREVPKISDPDLLKRREAANKRRYTLGELVHTLRDNLLTPFAYVEIAGWLSFFPLLGKTLAPGSWRKIQKSVEARLTPAVPTKPSIIDNPQEMSLEAQATAVAGMLRSIGLTQNFARLVFLCGHGSETENNPYASALDCGACGGNHGGASANLAASILNSKQIRKLLAQQGLNIPSETFFLGGEHNTTTDGISFTNADELPPSHRAEFEQFKHNLEIAGQKNAAERWQRLPGAASSPQPVGARVQQRAADWAQVRPEWGLVRNAAFICGRRSLTANLNLDNRVFLHSYEPQHDPQGTILEGILTAPVVVAEWINMQYYLSTVDNQRFGSSTKLLHTVVGQIGVMQGRQSDLMVGLPQQSVMYGDQPYHEPMRLSVIVEAPPARIANIIAKHKKLQDLTRNKWFTLVAYDSAAKTFYQYSTNDEWLEVDLATAEDEAQAA
jgi:uncharacterized protein YbcC (UPF0753/DUF2309 family)